MQLNGTATEAEVHNEAKIVTNAAKMNGAGAVAIAFSEHVTHQNVSLSTAGAMEHDETSNRLALEDDDPSVDNSQSLSSAIEGQGQRPETLQEATTQLNTTANDALLESQHTQWRPPRRPPALSQDAESYDEAVREGSAGSDSHTRERKLLPAPRPVASTALRQDILGHAEPAPAARSRRRSSVSVRRPSVDLPAFTDGGRPKSSLDIARQAQRKRDNQRRASLFGRTLSDEQQGSSDHLHSNLPRSRPPGRRLSIASNASNDAGESSRPGSSGDHRPRTSPVPAVQPASDLQAMLNQLHPDLLGYATDQGARRPSTSDGVAARPPPGRRRASLFRRSASDDVPDASALLHAEARVGSAGDGVGEKKMPLRGRRRSIEPRMDISLLELQVLHESVPQEPAVEGDVVDAVAWVVSTVEEVHAAGDLDEALWQTIRDLNRRTTKAVNEAEAQRVDDLFTELDANMSGGLDWNEVRQGAAMLGGVDEHHLKALFSKLCNQWREVGRMQFSVLVRSVKFSAVHGGTFVLECVEAVNALRARDPPKNDRGRRRSSVGSVVDEMAMNLSTGPIETADDRVKALAAQKLCYISRHGQHRERARRQSYISSMGALPALLRAMKAEDAQCQHWSVQALFQLVEHNQEVADNFTDIGGIAMVASLITQGKLVRKAQAGALFLVDATCNASRHGRRSLLRRQKNIIEFAVRTIDNTMFPPADPDERSRPRPTTARSTKEGQVASAQTELYWPLVSSAVELLATLSCEALVRPELLRTAMGPGLLAVATSGRTPSSALAASLAVSMLLGAAWPSWVPHATRKCIISIVVDALEKGTFSSSDGYESVWKVCMAVEVLSGNSGNRWEMRAMGVDKKLQQMLLVGAGRMHPSTQAECCLALWQFSFDDGPFKQVPAVYVAPPQQRAPRRLYHLIEPCKWPLKEDLGTIESFQLVVDDWDQLGAQRPPVVPGRHQMDVLKLLDLQGNVLWERWLSQLVGRVISGWKKISPAFKAATTMADDGVSLSKDELLSMFQSLETHDLQFSDKEVGWLFDAAVAPTGLERVTLHDLRVLGEAQSETFLEELAPNIIQGRRLRWLRGSVAWERVETPFNGDHTLVQVSPEGDSENGMKADMITGEIQVESKGGDMKSKIADTKNESEDSAHENTDSGLVEEDQTTEDPFQVFLAGAVRKDVGGEEIYQIDDRDMMVYRDEAGLPIRAVHAEPRDEMHLEVVGWEWMTERLVRVVESDDDDDRNYGKGDVVWDAKTQPADFLLRAVSEAEVVEPDPEEWEPEEDDDDEDEEELLGKTRQERTHDEAMAILQRDEVGDLQEAMVVAERTMLQRSFHEVDADGSGRVDPEEVMNALRQMGLAATEADVKGMMEAVDVGGRLRALTAKVLDMRARAATFDLGLKESERLELVRSEQEMAELQLALDIDEDGNFGFEGYVSMVHLNDASPHHLPRMAPFPQNLFTGKRLGKYSFRTVRSRPWLKVYSETPRTVEHLREISLQGTRPMGLQVSIFEPNACEKNAHGALMVCGEQPVVPAVPAIGYAFLSYDASAQDYVQDVNSVLKEIGMRAVDDRVTTHFQQQVRGAGVVIAIMTDSFQHSAQCRTELMLARQLGKTVILLQVEVFEVREVWLKHLLGIPIQRPTLFHTLPSCATWFRGSRHVTTTLSPPYTHIRPPIPAFQDTFSYFVQSEGTVARSNMVSLVKDLGWLVPEHAPLGKLSEGVLDRSDIQREVITGPMVIDFRRSPRLPELQATCRQAEEALQSVKMEHDAAADAAGEARSRSKAAELQLDDAVAAEDDWDGRLDAAAEALEQADSRLAAALERQQEAELALKTEKDVLAASTAMESAFADVVRAQEQRKTCVGRHHDASLQLEKAKQTAAKKREVHIVAAEEHQAARDRLESLQARMRIAEEEAGRHTAERNQELERAAVRAQTPEAVEALKMEIGQYQHLYRMGLFFGNATFFKCWIRICLFAGARVQLKRKLAPYMRRPMYYGFDALAWHREEMQQKRARLKKAVDAFYGNATRSAFLGWRSMCKIKQDSQVEAERVLKNFVAMWGESRKVDAFKGWHRAQVIRKNARELAYVRRREKAWWTWLEHWEGMVATFKAVAAKCSKFLAMLTGQAQVDSFHQWKLRVVNKKKARTFADSRNRRTLASIFEWLVQFEKESRLERRLHSEARDKLKNLIKVLASDKVANCFRGWDRHVRKKLASLRMWRETHLTKAWVSWFAILEEFYEVKRAVTSKCARLLLLLSGDAKHKCFFAWKDLLAKKRAAVRRWTHSSLIACWSRWAAVVDEAIRVRQLLANVHQTWGQRAARSSFQGWAGHADGRLYNRQLVADAINMWTNVRVIHAFRTLDEHARAAIHYRTVVGNFRTRFQLRPAQISILALSALVRDKIERKRLTRRVAFKYKNKWTVICFNRMREEVQDTKIGKALEDARRSDILRRMKQRALYAAFPYWVEGKDRSRLLRTISLQVWAKVRRRWLAQHFDRWANLFVDISFEDRHDALKKAAWAAIEGGGDLSNVVEVLASHPVWSKRRPHTRVAPHLQGFLLIREEFDSEAHSRAGRNQERREQLRFEKHQAGARARWDEELKLKVGDVLKLQQALAPLIADNPMYWRMIEGLSVILKKQNPPPPVEGESTSHQEQSTSGTDPGEVGTNEEQGGAVSGGNLLRVYPETPAPSARDVDVLDGIGWHQLAKISLTNTKAPALQQILPSYLGGRWAGVAVKRLHEQVHELFPLKQTKRWADEEQGLQLEEKKRRFLRTRSKALDLVERQRSKVRRAAEDLLHLEKAAADRLEEREAVQAERARLGAEAARLDDEDPFEHKKTIKALRSKAAAMATDEGASEQHVAAADREVQDAEPRMRAEEGRLLSMVVRISELLRGEAEAKRLMMWQDDAKERRRGVRWEDGGEQDGESNTLAAIQEDSATVGNAERRRAKLLEGRAGSDGQVMTGTFDGRMELVNWEGVETAIGMVGRRREDHEEELAQRARWIDATEKEDDTSILGGVSDQCGDSIWSEQVSELHGGDSPQSTSRQASSRGRVTPGGMSPVTAMMQKGRAALAGRSDGRSTGPEGVDGGRAGKSKGDGRATKFPRIAPQTQAGVGAAHRLEAGGAEVVLPPLPNTAIPGLDQREANNTVG